MAVWITVSDKSKLMERQADITFAPDAAGTELTIDVDGTQTFQQIDGFGASFTESSAWLLSTALNDGDRATLMTRFFDPIAGIGLNILRQPIGGVRAERRL